MIRHGKKRVEAFLDMTPLIDVVFLLLIFFMVSTTFDDLSGFKLNLPQSTSDENIPKEILTIIVSDKMEHSLVIVDSSGKKEVINVDKVNLEKELLIFSKNLNTITLAADGGVKYQYIIDIMTIAKKSGFLNINIKTKK